MRGMLRRLWRFGGLALVVCFGMRTPCAQETLTNADVVKMVQAHLSADVIVQQIESNPGNYVLTTSSLIRLKQAGVPDKVIASMQAKNKLAPPRTEHSSPPPNGSALSDACGSSGGKWQIMRVEHGLRGSFPEAHYCLPFGSARAELIAICGESSFDLGVAYFSHDELGIDLSGTSAKFYRGEVRVKVGNFDPWRYAATLEQKNHITLTLWDNAAMFENPDDFQEHFKAATQENQHDFDIADRVSIELPLTDGETPVVDFSFQDPVFRKFYTQCYWNPYPLRAPAAAPPETPLASQDSPRAAQMVVPSAASTPASANAASSGELTMLTPHPVSPSPAGPAPALADIQKQADALWKEKRFAEAVPLYDKACNAGNQAACTGLGWAYFHGNGIQQNDVHGMDLWAKACDAGHGDGCGNLVVIYDLTGAGPAKILPVAIKGCDLGEGSSCFALGRDYWTGTAVARDRDKAKQLFQKACDQGVKAGCDPKMWPLDE